MYTLDLAPTERTIAKQAYRAGQPIPDRIKNAPRLQLGLTLYFDAFFDLDAERKHDNGFAYIPRSAMWAYAQQYNLTDEQTEDLLYLVREMDIAHIKRLEAKTKTT